MKEKDAREMTVVNWSWIGGLLMLCRGSGTVRSQCEL